MFVDVHARVFLRVYLCVCVFVSVCVCVCVQIFTVPVHRRMRFMILASDGLWDMVTNEEAVGMVAQCLAAKCRGGTVSTEEYRKQKEGACAEACRLMLRRALTRWTQHVGRADNVTVGVVAFNFD